MLITGSKIIEDKLLEGASEKNISGGCYYLQIHSIIPAGKRAKSCDAKKPQNFYTLEPGGMAWIISQETFGIKDTSISALVTLRSGFTKKGMLALDVGLVDANFSGPIGTLVINFSQKPIRLKAGDQFFRVIFMQHDEPSTKYAPKTVKFTHEEYIDQVLSEAVGGYSSTFLQTAEIEARIRANIEGSLIEKLEPQLLEKLFTHFLTKNFKLIGVLLILLLGVTGFVGWNYLHSTTKIRKIVDEQLEHSMSIDERLEALEAKVE